VIVADLLVRFAGAFPSSATPAPVLVKVGLVKLRVAGAAVQPVVGVSASVIVPEAAIWYSTAIVCATGVAAPPSRHCSPRYAMSTEVSAEPVLLVKQAAQ
jgi:hypothetical protein